MFKNIVIKHTNAPVHDIWSMVALFYNFSKTYTYKEEKEKEGFIRLTAIMILEGVNVI